MDQNNQNDQKDQDDQYRIPWIIENKEKTAAEVESETEDKIEDVKTDKDSEIIEEVKIEKHKLTIEEEKKECLGQANIILEKHKIISNIPIDSPYWRLMNRFRSLSNP